MALTNTTLAADCSASDLTLSITSTSSGFPAVGTMNTRQLMLVDGEYMMLDRVVASGVVKVLMRGYNGTTAAAHDVLANVATSSDPADFGAYGVGQSVPRPLSADLIVSVGENGVVPVPVQNTTVFLTKASALSSTTLAAPLTSNNGVRLTITSQTAAAHVITATSLLGDGVSGSPHTTATWAAYIGASLTLEASDGIWNVISAVGVTIT